MGTGDELPCSGLLRQALASSRNVAATPAAASAGNGSVPRAWSVNKVKSAIVKSETSLLGQASTRTHQWTGNNSPRVCPA